MQNVINSSTNVRSFYEHYQATAEFEGKNKVKRLEENIPKYKRAFQKNSIFEDIDYWNNWEQLNVDLRNNNSKPTESNPFDVKAKRLVKIQHEKVNNFDGLNGLSTTLEIFKDLNDMKMLDTVQNEIVEKLTSLGVRLDKNKELDLSQIKNEE